MQDFWIYFKIGIQHIADWQGYDHILFIMALCLRYLLKDWKKVLILVTAFTIGHSITLALSVLGYINFSRDWIEFLIPVTIVVTALNNVLQPEIKSTTRLPFVYFLALFVGLIHGLGFSNLLRSMLGKQESVVTELLGFNLGLEVGQVMIVLGVLLLTWIFVTLIRVPRREYTLFMSGAIFGVAFIMCIERFAIAIN